MVGLSKTKRMPGIDVARGLVISGVVFNHAVDGLVTAGLLDTASVVNSFNQALYIFRMPALAFLLGLFIPNAVRKRGNQGYLRERVTFALYVYIVWFFLQTATEVLTSHLRNGSSEWVDILEIWTMPAHLWFLPFLAVATTLAVAASPWKSTRRAWATVPPIALISMAAWGWNPDGWFGIRGASLFVFVLLGAVLGIERVGAAMNSRWWVPATVGTLSALVFAMFLAAGIIPGTLHIETPWSIRGRSILAAGVGIVLVLSVAALTIRLSPARKVFAFLGQYTLQIYAAHVIVTAGTRIALTAAGIDNAAAVLVAAVVFGVLIPVALALTAPKIGLAWLFAPPEMLSRWSKEANQRDWADKTG